MMNILILSGKFGMGHVAAAAALQSQMQARFPGARVTVCDIVEHLMPQGSGTLYRSFGVLVRHAKLLYNLYYTGSDKLPQPCKNAAAGIFLRSFRRLMLLWQPDVVIATLPFGAQLVSFYKKLYPGSLCAVTCITDVSAHNEWISPDTDLYFVPAAEVKWELMRKGIAADKIQVSGIPVRDQFHCGGDGTSHTGRELLICGGGLCLLPRQGSKFYSALSRVPGLHTTILTGTNRTLYEKLQGRWDNIDVVSFTDHVEEYMRGADLLLSKPGGITLFESIYEGVPMLVYRPELGQEKKNARFIERHDIGRVCWEKSDDVVAEIVDLLDDTEQLARMRENIKAVRRSLHKDPAAAIARQIQWQEVAQ